MAMVQGLISGMDVILAPNQGVRCLAFIGEPSGREIQVVTDVAQLQDALGVATAAKVTVEATFDDRHGEHILTRVRILDRG